MKLLALSLIALIATCKALAQESNDERWEYIGQSAGKEKYYIDLMTKYKLDDVFGFKEVWIKCVTPLKRLKKGGKTLTYYNTVTLTLHEINCSKNEMKIKQEIIYDSKGKLIDSWENEVGSFKKVVPGTIGEMVIEQSCKVH